MSEKRLKLAIPLDEDGFIEMECDYCKMRFMLHKDGYEDESNLHFFCPICGIPNKINTFFVPEVLEKAQQMAMNYALGEMEKALCKSMKQINRSGIIKMSIKKTKRLKERELYTPSENYVKCRNQCCNIDVKVKNIDIETGTYCPICGNEPQLLKVNSQSEIYCLEQFFNYITNTPFLIDYINSCKIKEYDFKQIFSEEGWHNVLSLPSDEKELVSYGYQLLQYILDGPKDLFGLSMGYVNSNKYADNIEA